MLGYRLDADRERLGELVDGWPIWSVLDMTPDGRRAGSGFPRLDYEWSPPARGQGVAAR
jgi:hypothetical protein